MATSNSSQPLQYVYRQRREFLDFQFSKEKHCEVEKDRGDYCIGMANSQWELLTVPLNSFQASSQVFRSSSYSK